jgi:choline dehydrogenase-like flavoprotein
MLDQNVDHSRVKDRSTMSIIAEHHGVDGPIKTSFNQDAMDIEYDFIRAADEAAGYKVRPEDAWSGQHLGFFHTLGTIGRTGEDAGKRSYSARACLNKSRPNLNVLCEARVVSIQLEGIRATKVSFLFDGKQYTVAAKREIIVSCGTIQSPQILELSGIGNPEILERAGVKCLVENMDVGENYQDHAAVVGPTRSSCTLRSWVVVLTTVTLDGCVGARFWRSQYGHSATAGCHGGGTERAGRARFRFVDIDAECARLLPVQGKIVISPSSQSSG